MVAEVEPDTEFYPLRAQLENKAYVGPEGLKEMFADFDQDWEYIRIEFDELLEREDLVVALCRLHARGIASRVDLEVPMGFVLRFEGSRLVYSRSYSEQADALRAAGLG